MITQFHGPFRFLSNFEPPPVVVDGAPYPTVEHAYQAMKTLDLDWRERIRRAPTPGKAKHMGQQLVNLRPDWEEIKISVMTDLVRKKFNHGPAKLQLIATGDAWLIEGNSWGDTFWGAVHDNGEWIGQNNLGKILMLIREELAPHLRSWSER